MKQNKKKQKKLFSETFSEPEIESSAMIFKIQYIHNHSPASIISPSSASAAVSDYNFSIIAALLFHFFFLFYFLLPLSLSLSLALTQFQAE
jgi:hypothetical protein